MSQKNVEIVRAIYDQYAKGNLGAALARYDPDTMFILREVPDAERRYVGVESIKEFMRDWLKAWKEFTMTAEEVIEAGDSVVLSVQMRAAGRDSGVPAEFTYWEIWTFRGDAVIRIEQFADRTSALEAAGLSE